MKSFKNIFLIGFVAVNIALFWGGYLFFSKANNSLGTTSKINNTKTNKNLCGLIYKNKEQGYEVCLPRGWYFQEFGEIKETTGFDNRPIPKATDYIGRFYIKIKNGRIEEEIGRIENNLTGKTKKNIIVNGKDGLMIEGIIVNSPFFIGQNQITVLIGTNERCFEITFQAAADQYIFLKPTFLSFLESFKITNSKPTITQSDEGNIVLSKPVIKSIVSSPIEISGKTTFKEKTLNIAIIDGNEKILGQEAIWIYENNFSGEIFYNEGEGPKEAELILTVEENKKEEKLFIPIILK